MLEAALSALAILFDPLHLLALVGGILMGMVFGAVPGLGGIIGLGILLPFTFGTEPTIAFALMFGMLSVISTADTIPAVLFGVPGTTAAQATILDGYALARKGQAEEALSVAFLSSIVGGLFGALVLTLSIPVMRPLILAFGSPEFFMMGLMGITMIASLSGGNVWRGLAAGALGLCLGMIGLAPQSPVPRWTFGIPYLLDGIPMVPLVLGLFAVPEMMELYTSGTEKKRSTGLGAAAGLLSRFKSAIGTLYRHKFLVIRSGIVGTIVGAIPGLGSSVVDWIAYGHAVATERGAMQTFGKGDIRGVIAPESANNSKSGGELIPTLAFGIPGSAPMALVLAAMMVMNIRPGPEMLTVHLNITMLLIWTIVLANIISGLLCFVATPKIASIARLPNHYIVPFVLIIVAFASFQASKQVGDLVVLFGAGMLGWFMKMAGFSRPALVLAFVLSPIIENYLFISFTRYGWGWVSRPMVLVLLIITVGSIVYGFRGSGREQEVLAEGGEAATNEG